MIPQKKPLHVVMIYGAMSSSNRGPYDIAGLYTRQGLTGSESSFFNLARSLAEIGHEVVVMADVTQPTQHASGFHAMPLQAINGLSSMRDVDVVIAWNEPDYLAYVPHGVLRICDQQLNDFRYVRGPLGALSDIWVAPSQNHLDYLTMFEHLPIGGTRVIPNSVDLDLVRSADTLEVPSKRVVYCSSPDRGLHHLVGLWPEVRKREPSAELHIYYRLAGWLNDVSGCGPWSQSHPDVCESARRARYVAEALRRMSTGFGVHVHDVVPNKQMLEELHRARVLAYPCDPIRYTEGFGVSVLDAVACGVRAIITDADALPSVHADGAYKILSREIDRAAWVDAICSALNEPGLTDRSARAQDYIKRHDRISVARRWEALIYEQLHFRTIPTRQPQEFPEITYPEAGRALRVRERSIDGNTFRFWETETHGSWWSMEDEQNVRDRHWHPKPGEVVLDVGAAFGSYALPALALGARVVAFSPADPDTQLLVANLDLNPEFADRFSLSRDGIADRDCWFDPARSVYAEQPGDATWLRCRSLDSWLAENPLDRVDLIKLDVEGAELDALRGAEGLIRRFRPRILVECHNFHRPMSEPVIAFVQSLGLGYRVEIHPHGGVAHAFFDVPDAA